MDNSYQASLKLAFLGATGQTGQKTLNRLLDTKFNKLNIYVRTRAKLLAQNPEIESDTRIKIFEGAINDQQVIQQCLTDAQVIICTMGSDGMAPDTVIQDSASSIITALQVLRRKSSKLWERPRIIWLSSGTLNKRSVAARPKIVHWLIETAFQLGYNDLKVAQKILLLDESLASVLLVQPNVLIHHEPSGHEITTGPAKLGVTYTDLGNAFVELAMVDRYIQLAAVSVSSYEGDNLPAFAPVIISRITRGMFVNFFPFGVHINRFLQRLLS